MESQGEPGRIQLGPRAYELLEHDFHCELRAGQDIRGKGMMRTWWLVGGVGQCP